MKFLLLPAVLLCTAFSLIGAELKVAILSDIHVSPGNPNEQRLQQAIAEINESDVDQVIVTGDLSNRGATAELVRVKELLDQLNKPYRALPGNHETNWSDSGALAFAELFRSERFAFERNGVLLIGFSTGPYLKMGDGHVRAEDIAFLKDTLAERAADQKPVIVFCHYPLADELSNGVEVAEVLAPYHVLGLVCGHTHVQFRRNIYGIDNIVCRPLTSNDGKTFGYNFIVYDNGKLEAWEKRLGDPVEKDFNVRPPLKKPEIVFGGNLPVDVRVETIWEESASIYTGAAVHGTELFYGTSNGMLVRLLTTKLQNPAVRPVRTLELGTPFYSTPVYADDTVIIGSLQRKILGIDPGTLKIRWELPANAPVTNTGIFADGSVFMGLGSGSFARLEPHSGKIVWQTDGGYGTFQGAPATDGKIVVFGAWDTRLYALDAVNGKQLWKWSSGSTQVLFSPGNVAPAIAAGQVLFVAPDRYMTALDAATGKQVWRTNRFKVRESFGRSADGKTVYAKTMDGLLIAVETGKPEFTLRWQCDLKFGYEHAPCPVLEANGVVYAGSRSGVIAAVDAATGALLWTYKVGTTSVNSFTAAPSGDVYATLLEGKIVRIFRQ